MKAYIVVIALINGMIGGLILVLPILAMYGGSILSLLIILATGFFSYYSCYLCVLHLGEHSDLDKAILSHFNQSRVIQIFYDFLVFIGFLFLLMLYFELIVTQWQGLLPYNVANPICNAVALVILTFALNYFHFGAKLLGYGIISIIAYCIFLIWLISTAPNGNKEVPLFGTGAVNLAASMGQAFAIQGFFIPVLRELPDSKKYPKYVLIAYLIGGSVYLYIAFAGSFGIVNRETYPPGIIPQTIQSYFTRGQWQVSIVEVIYLIHLYSAYGEFLLVCKKRLFNIFRLKQSKGGQILNIPQIIFVVILIGITVGIYFGNVSIQTLIQINGAILGFFFIYLLPAAMHFKCLYLPSSKKTLVVQLQPSINQDETGKYIQMRQMEGSERQSEDVNKQESISPQRVSGLSIENEKVRQKQNQNQKQNQMQIQKQKQKQGNINLQQTKNNSFFNNNVKIQNFSCTCKKPKPLYQVLDLIAMFGMVGLGAFIMIQGFVSLITGQ